MSDTNDTPAAPPRRRGCLWWLGLASAITLAAIVIVVIAIAAGVEEDEQAEADEVTLTGCDPNTLNLIEVSGEVHNTSSGRSNYLIELVVEDGDGVQVGSGIAFVSNVEADQRARWDTVTDASGDGEVSCRVIAVDRTAAL